MMPKVPETWQIPSVLGPCVCSQLRRAARKVTSLYDLTLAATGLTVTQHGLLVNIARAGDIGRSSLALRVGMDRTTLTRNLKPLETAKLVLPAQSNDGRERLLRVSPEGLRLLRRSYLLWEEAQKKLSSEIGVRKLKQLRSSLETAEKAATAALRRTQPI